MRSVNISTKFWFFFYTIYHLPGKNQFSWIPATVKPMVPWGATMTSSGIPREYPPCPFCSQKGLVLLLGHTCLMPSAIPFPEKKVGHFCRNFFERPLNIKNCTWCSPVYKAIGCFETTFLQIHNSLKKGIFLNLKVNFSGNFQSRSNELIIEQYTKNEFVQKACNIYTLSKLVKN